MEEEVFLLQMNFCFNDDMIYDLEIRAQDKFNTVLITTLFLIQ